MSKDMFQIQLTVWDITLMSANAMHLNQWAPVQVSHCHMDKCFHQLW